MPSPPVGPSDSSAAALEGLGYDAWVASELEFYLCTPDGQPLDDDVRCWSMTRGAEYEPVIGEIRSTLLACGVPVVSSQTEGGPGQWEINVGPASPIETADNAAILKYVEFRFRPQVQIGDGAVRQVYEWEYGSRAEPPSFDAVAPEIRRQLADRELDAKIEAWVKELREGAEIRYNP